jgi:signal transduction histidine kinase
MAQSPDQLDPRPEVVNLYAETRAAVERYGGQMEARGLVLKWAWAVPTASGPRVRLDVRLFDILLTNLLDNACKYSFENRTITVGCDVLRRVGKVRLWVEDIGVPIPDSARDAIYRPGVRSAARDRVRAIAGEGIGLFLCRAIAEAHGGTLDHRCSPDPLSTRPGPPGPTDPWRVRFTFTFPSRS